MSCGSREVFLLKYESQSSLIQSFWFGKALQRASNEGKPLPNVNSVNENGEFVNPTEHKETSLSRNVHKLICESFEQRDHAVISYTECSITSAEIENLEIWVKISRLLREGTARNLSVDSCSNAYIMCGRDVAERKLSRLFYRSSCLFYSTAASKSPHLFVFQSNLSWWQGLFQPVKLAASLDLLQVDFS